jgi:hypothetical protein
MTIIDNPAERAVWLTDASRVIVSLQRMETEISRALGQYLTFTQMQHLSSADQQLGIAARAIQAATNEIKRI